MQNNELKKSSEMLRRCPFCGGEAEISDGEFINGHFVFCTQCHIQTKLYTLGNTREKAINDWNTRKPVDDLVYVFEKKKEKIDKNVFVEERSFLGAIIEIIKEEVG